MLKPILTFVLLSLGIIAHAQVSGNANYQNQTRLSANNINVNSPSNANITISIAGLANVKADAYVAIFSVTQTGKTADEVNTLLDSRINEATEKIKAITNTETYIDMVSFVPVYEYDIEKKIFSKRSYNEVPIGFELKKNIHIKYLNANALNQIISTLASSEIYDLVKVDYFAQSLETQKKDLMLKAKTLLAEKLKYHQSLTASNLDTIERQITDGFRVVYPIELYTSYQAYSSTALSAKKLASSTQANKSTTSYYQAIADKEFDFVINPIVLEPVIQVMYEIKMTLNREKANYTKKQTQYLLITPSGEVKPLDGVR